MSYTVETTADGKRRIKLHAPVTEPKKESVAEKALSPLKKLWKKLTGK